MSACLGVGFKIGGNWMWFSYFKNFSQMLNLEV